MSTLSIEWNERMVAQMGKILRDRGRDPSPEVRELERQLLETRAQIAQAYAGFNSAADEALVEYYIYEIQALQARYSYLLRRRKVLGGEESAHAPLESPGPSALPVA